MNSSGTLIIFPCFPSWTEYNIPIMSHKTVPMLLLLLVLALPCTGYSIQGTWKLQLDSSYKNLSADNPVIFDFKKQIANGSITNTVSVFACSLIQFGLVLADSSASFTLGRIGVARRPCVKDQVSELIGRMEKIAFTSTIANNLMFLAPSGKILMRLTKIEATNSSRNSPLAGVWQVTKLQDQTPASLILKSNNSQVQFCNGNAIVDYKLPRTNTINFRIKQTKGCAQNDLLTNLFRATYMRTFNDQVLIYNQDVELVMRWGLLGEVQGNKDVGFQGSVVKIVAEGNANSTAVPEDQKVASGVAPPPPIVTKSKKDADSIDSLDAPKVQTSNPPQTLVLSATATVPISSAPARSYQPSLRKQQIFTKWYFIGSPTEVMAVITANRIMVYGDCGVWFTMINVREAGDRVEVFNNQAKDSVGTCLGKNNAFEALLNNLRYIKMEVNGKNQKLLVYFDKDGKQIGEWANFKQK